MRKSSLVEGEKEEDKAIEQASGRQEKAGAVPETHLEKMANL